MYRVTAKRQCHCLYWTTILPQPWQLFATLHFTMQKFTIISCCALDTYSRSKKTLFLTRLNASTVPDSADGTEPRSFHSGFGGAQHEPHQRIRTCRLFAVYLCIWNLQRHKHRSVFHGFETFRKIASLMEPHIYSFDKYSIYPYFPAIFISSIGQSKEIQLRAWG